MKNGCILVGGVGSGKSRTALAYYYTEVCEGQIKTNGNGGFSQFRKPRDLYIITTARKRDTLDWEVELAPFLLSSIKPENAQGVKVTVDSWNNVKKYTNVKNAFFIFDEQRVVGAGVWVKSFQKITQSNLWVLLSATPGDVWEDYIPTFIANGYYKNRTEFIRRHIVYNHYSKFPKVDHYVEVARLIKIRDSIVINMKFKKRTIAHDEDVVVPFDRELYNTVMIQRWNVYEKRPIRDVAELCHVMRKVVNSDPRRIDITEQLIEKHPKTIIFYNFNYERDLLLEMAERIESPIAQWNGHKHEQIPETEKWVYIVQYAAGAEGWNCIETDTIIFYSQNYSYKAMIQAAGRIDRLNTSFTDLFYYHLRSNSLIDIAIAKALNKKRNFNENRFMDI